MVHPHARIILLLLDVFASSVHATGLIQALQNAGASQFAAQIQADPDAATFYLSNRVQTVFAPVDSSTNSTLGKLRRRQSSPQALQELLYHSTANTNTLGSMSSGSGLAMKSNDNSPKLGNNPQVFVSTPVGPSPNTCGTRELVDSNDPDPDHWLWWWPWVYITVSVSVYIEVPVTVFVTTDDIHFTTIRGTEFITISATEFTTEVTTVHDTDFVTIPTTQVTTVSETDYVTQVTTVPTTIKETEVVTVSATQLVTVPTTETVTILTTAEETSLITVPVTVVTTDLSTFVETISVTKITTVPTTVPTTVISIVSTTIISTLLSTLLSTVPMTVQDTKLITKVTTVPTTVPTTVLSLLSTKVISTLLSTVPTTVPTTVLSTVSTKVISTLLSTVPTTVPTTVLSTVSTKVISTLLSTVPTTVPTTVLSTVSTEAISTLISTRSTTVQDTKLITKPTTIPKTVHNTIISKVPTTVSTIVTTRQLPTSTPGLVKISSGLGNSVNVISGDIPYDGGLIQLIDGYFTLPEALIDTANLNGQTAFTGLAKSYNQTDTLNNTPDITYFIPNNGAFAMEDSTNSYSTIEDLLLGHLVPNFAGYLPSLNNGATYRSQGGSQFTVSSRGSDYYVNNAKIVLPNVIVENGVAHVIDQVIKPNPTPTQAKPNAAGSLQVDLLQIKIAASICMLFLAEALLV